MNSKKIKNISGLGLLCLFCAHVGAAYAVDQIVRPVGATSFDARIGSDIEICFEYATSDNSTNATGIGIRLHHDASKLQWTTVSKVFSKDLIAIDTAPGIDTGNQDNNASTDLVFLSAWTNFSGQFPNQAVPITLECHNYHVPDTLQAGDSTQINLTRSSGQAGTGFVGTSAHINFVTCAVLDVDCSGSSQALTDGLLILRRLFGFSGTSLTNNAVDTALCKRCTAAEIADYIDSLVTVLPPIKEPVNPPPPPPPPNI